jgi:hypothetical protein
MLKDTHFMHKAFLNEQLLGKFGTLIFLMYAKKEY